jgi:formylglycine-generating enzyme required for sulfatase activity
VECVSWEDAVAICRKLSAKEGQEYRLPTEAEWEYACRAGTTTPFSFGSVLKGQEANCDGNYPYGTTTKGPFLGRTTKVGSYAANAFGLYDMHGNVWEWCADWYDAEYYKHSPSEDPPGAASGSYRVYRGGGWFLDASGCRASCRRGGVPGYRGAILGFRLARTVSSR